MTTTFAGNHAPSTDYDPFAPEALADPFHYDGELREFSSVAYLEKYDVYAITRQEQLHQVGRDRKTFSNKSRPFADPNSAYKPALLQLQDPPEHTQVKKLALELFSKANLEYLEAAFNDEAERRISELMSNGEVEIEAVSSLATPFISTVFLDAVGAPREGRELLKYYADAALNSSAPKNEHFHKKMEIGAPALEWVEKNMKRETAGQRGWGRDVYTMVDEGRLSEEDGEQLIKMIFTAGFDTTVASISNSVKAFADNPHQWALLKSDPSIIDNAFDEVLRLYPPVRYTGRMATRDVEVDGHLIREGGLVMTMWLSGGRDPRFWDRPDEFDITRKNANGHMTFGVGIHSCLGQHIARMEAKAVIGALLRHVDTMRPTGVSEIADNMQGFAHTTVPVVLTPAT
ncbi:cytochrome P450 [Cedecea colo]|nr:cytochrome P450 [Cedecea colo]